jgi:hypothetical protein
MDSTRPRVHPQEALAVYAEPLAVGRRVAVFGDASTGLGSRLVELGARSVQVWDPDFDRATREGDRAPRGVVVHPFLGDEPESRAGAFDLVLVPDLGGFEDAEELVARIRRLVGDTGAALIAAPSGGESRPSEDGEGLDYYELFDLVAQEFRDVVMVAELAFRGVALVELGEGEGGSPSVSVDTQLAEGERAPRGFLALASERGVRLDPYAIVELPGLPVPAAVSASEVGRAAARKAHAVEEPAGDRPAIARDARADADEEDEDAEEDADDEDEQKAEAAEAAAAQMAVAYERIRMRAAALEAEVEELSLRLADAERRAEVVPRLEAALLEGTSRLAELENALFTRERQVEGLSEESMRLQAALDAVRVAASQLDELALRAERAELALAVSEPELARVDEAHALELARYEAALRDRGYAVSRLEAELVRRERMVEDLIDTLAEGSHTAATAPTPGGNESEGATATRAPSLRPESRPPAAESAGRLEVERVAEENTRLRHQLDGVALELARREGEAQANLWTIAELERRLQTEAAPPMGSVASPPSLPQAPPASGGPKNSGSGDGSSSEEGPVPDAGPQLASALDELDVLRRALAQEHAARQRAESGEELARARAEIERQAVLLAELQDRPQ